MQLPNPVVNNCEPESSVSTLEVPYEVLKSRLRFRPLFDDRHVSPSSGRKPSRSIDVWAVPSSGKNEEKEGGRRPRLLDLDPLGREADEVRRDDQDGEEHVTPPNVRVFRSRPLSARRGPATGRGRRSQSNAACGLAGSKRSPPGRGPARSRVQADLSAGSAEACPPTRRTVAGLRTRRTCVTPRALRSWTGDPPRSSATPP